MLLAGRFLLRRLLTSEQIGLLNKAIAEAEQNLDKSQTKFYYVRYQLSQQLSKGFPTFQLDFAVELSVFLMRLRQRKRRRKRRRRR